MAQESRVSSAMRVSATPPPQAAGSLLQWDGRSDVCRDLGLATGSGPGPQSTFQAQGPPATGTNARRYWTTGAIGLNPSVSPQTIVWEQEAARVTFDLDAGLLSEATHAAIPGATGELVWVSWPETAESHTPMVHPVLLMHSTHDSLAVARVLMGLSLPAHDPLLHHLALVLQAALAAEGRAGQLYAESLTEALVVHFLRRYAAAPQAPCEGTGGLSPSTLRRTITYIQAHLAQTLSLARLAAVAQTSPAHFARQFKQATGLSPHQYVIRCRMVQARQLLAATDLPLSVIGLQVGCADQSHFTALFRTHVALTPKAFRDHARRA